jgi:hypothetical protein
MPWCPSCGDEFRPGIEQCPDCQVGLTAEPPPPEPSESHPPAVRSTVTLGPDDDPVEVAWLGATEAELVAGELRASGIAAMVVGVSPLAGEGGPALQFSEGSRLVVRRRDVDAARAIVDRPTDAPMSDAELAAQAELAAGTDFGDGAVV